MKRFLFVVATLLSAAFATVAFAQNLDENGALPEKYCGDPEPEGQGIHFTNEACKIWVDYLKNNA